MQLYAHPMRQEWRNIMILHITVVAVLLPVLELVQQLHCS